VKRRSDLGYVQVQSVSTSYILRISTCLAETEAEAEGVKGVSVLFQLHWNGSTM
jgi:hypothetical protein